MLGGYLSQLGTIQLGTALSFGSGAGVIQPSGEIVTIDATFHTAVTLDATVHQTVTVEAER